MKEKEIITLIKISKVKPLRKKLPLLARNFKPLSELLEKKKEELLQYFSQELVELILKAKTLPYEVELKKLKNLQAKVISWEDEEYPTKLKEISTPPPFLYVRGELTQEDRTSVAIVGSRLASYYGKQVAYKLAYHLALNGVTIVSGLARGIDTYAHKGALDAGGRTIGVLGCGIDYIYPKGNEPLMHRILQNGACLTEFPIGEIPLPYNFPFRNRLISGLSLGVIVVEARLKSGTFSTVRWALEQGREVFAVPGNIDSEPSKGVNKLIQEGATLITSAEDVLTYLKIRHLKRKTNIENKLSLKEKKIWTYLSTTPIHIDKLSSVLNLEVKELLTLLLQMELKGIVKEVGGKNFIKTI